MVEDRHRQQRYKVRVFSTSRVLSSALILCSLESCDSCGERARFPVVVEEFGLRAKSGGAGQWNGGDGVVRRLRFRRPLQVIQAAKSRGIDASLEGGSDNATRL